jgi:hypothetical protein
MKSFATKSMDDRDRSTSSDDEPLNTTKLKTIRKINEYHPTAIAAVTCEQHNPSYHSLLIRQSDSAHCSTTSLDSIENKTIESSVNTTRLKTTFSDLSSQRVLNCVSMPRADPTMETKKLTRTFAFDRACMEKFGQVSEQNDETIDYPATIVESTLRNEESNRRLSANRSR